MVLSHGFWTRALGGDPSAVGRSVSVNGIGFTVVGVAPPAFRGVSPVEGAPDAWFPIAMHGALTRMPDMALAAHAQDIFATLRPFHDRFIAQED